MAAKAIQTFQLTEEYSTVLFSWYHKGFELLRRYLVKHGPGVDLVKHGPGVDLVNLDLESINK